MKIPEKQRIKNKKVYLEKEKIEKKQKNIY